jgi:hypothetical protein
MLIHQTCIGFHVWRNSPRQREYPYHLVQSDDPPHPRIPHHTPLLQHGRQLLRLIHRESRIQKCWNIHLMYRRSFHFRAMHQTADASWMRRVARIQIQVLGQRKK